MNQVHSLHHGAVSSSHSEQSCLLEHGIPGESLCAMCHPLCKSCSVLDGFPFFGRWVCWAVEFSLSLGAGKNCIPKDMEHCSLLLPFWDDFEITSTGNNPTIMIVLCNATSHSPLKWCYFMMKVLTDGLNLPSFDAWPVSEYYQNWKANSPSLATSSNAVVRE